MVHDRVCDRRQEQDLEGKRSERNGDREENEGKYSQEAVCSHHREYEHDELDGRICVASWSRTVRADGPPYVDAIRGREDDFEHVKQLEGCLGSHQDTSDRGVNVRAGADDDGKEGD